MPVHINEDSITVKGIFTNEDIALFRESGAIEKMVDFASRMHLYNSAIKEIRTKLEILDGEFQIKYDYNPIHHIESRLKSPRSIIEKLHRKGSPVTLAGMSEYLHDIAGVRVICNYLDDVEMIAKFLLSQDDVTLLNTKDYVKNPKPSGYRSLHLIVSIPIFLSEHTEQVPVEIQIRTIAMDFWASLEHKMKYKTNGDVTPEQQERMRKCAADIAKVEEEMQQIHKELYE